MSEDQIFVGIMELNEAKTHQIKLKQKNVNLTFKTNPSTCTSGCKVTVEVWGEISDKGPLEEYFRETYLKSLKGHMPNFDLMNEVFDPSKKEVICQACGASFSSGISTCPDCGLVYF